MLCVTRGSSCDHRHPVNSLFVAKSKLFPTTSSVTDLLTVYVLGSFFLVCCYHHYCVFSSPPFLERFKLIFSNKFVTFVAIYPKELFIVRCLNILGTLSIDDEGDDDDK